MDMQKRDELRDLQDKVIVIARRRGIAYEDPFLSDGTTLFDVANTLYPAMEEHFRDILRDYGQPV